LYTEYLNITPTGLCITPEILRDRKLGNGRFDNMFDLTTVKSNVKGELSFNSVSRLKKAFYLLAAISPTKFFLHPSTLKKIPFRLSFITLTLSAIQGANSDYKIKQQLLNHFLVHARRSFGMQHYIWKAEPQKNGNIHFHIVTNIFIRHEVLRDSWNNIQKKLGFIDLFNDKYHHINPNSTDIHSVFKIKKLGAYVAKYLSKNDDESRKIQGKIWDCSRSLKSKLSCKFQIADDHYKLLYDIEGKLQERVIHADFFRFIPLSESELKSLLPKPWQISYESYLRKIQST
jgi:hypothetical protein